MADNRLTSGQRKAQTHQVSANIQAEAQAIAANTGCSLDDAMQQVWKDAALLAKCHAVGEPTTFSPSWTEPES